MTFEWDYIKELSNIKKHGFSFAVAVETFYDPDGFSLEDPRHSQSEERFYWIGKSVQGKVLTTRFSWRSDKIRIFGCAEWREFRGYNRRR